MIHDLDETIKQILTQQGKLNAGDIDILFDQPTGEWAAGLTRPTINIYLYDIRENTELRRNLQRTVERVNGSGRSTFAPRRIDLNYLITVWARNPEDEHQLLWRVLRTLMQFGGINPEDGVGAVVEQPFKLPVQIALPSDAVRNMPDLWGVMENQLKPSVNMTITVALETDLAIEAPLVLTSTFRVGQGLPETQQLTHVDVEIYHIGGRVISEDTPAGAGVQVTLLNRGDTVETDAAGQFVFAYLQPGEYDVEIIAEGRKAKRHSITVPSDNYDLPL
ncbi:MAG: DUF4255 domain-containing protein [Chloroflexi bacterium]|nr:DUF4255 domain-containing protein [Chloroflexota bacterium]